ncbi:MAG TPA: acyl-ACP thioesterase, partial [Rhodospirillales bacterium]|nr:acyl-ACP thioesterase [Rhodospirillales bacterium]
MSEYFETLRGLITPSDCDENAVITSSALSACMADATAHALHTLGLGPRQMRQSRERVRLIHEHLDRQFDLGPGDIFHVESTLLSTDQEAHILEHRMIDSAGGAISCVARTQVTAPPLPQTETAEPADQVGVETYRGRVSSAQCDQMRHMNVQYYMEKNSQALAQIGNMLGLGKGFYPQTERILFERELYAGDVLVMRSAIRQVEDDRVHVASQLLNGENGDVAARFETVARLWNPADGALQPLSSGVRKLALSFAPATEDDFPLPRPITGPRASADVPPNTIVTCRRAVNTWQTDAT